MAVPLLSNLQQRSRAWTDPRLVRRSRRRLRFLNWENERFDRKRGIETGGWMELKEGTLVGDEETGNLFGAHHVRGIRWTLRKLPADRSEFTFIDFGSGKGRIVFVAAAEGFGRAIGVEFVEELHHAALANARRLRPPHDLPVEAVLADATQYEFPMTPLVLYFNNPFHEPVMAKLLENLEASHRKKPRPIFAIYHQARAEPEDRATHNVEVLADSAVFSRHRRLEKTTLRERILLGAYRADQFESPEAVRLAR